MSTDISDDSTISGLRIEAERCIAELQRGRAVVLTEQIQGSDGQQTAYRVIQLVETMEQHDLKTLVSTQRCQLVLTRARALALELMVDSSAVCLELAPDTAIEAIHDWAGLNPAVVSENHARASTHLGGIHQSEESVQTPALTGHAPSSHYANAALNLAHHAHVLPAFIMHSVDEPAPHLLCLSTQAAQLYTDNSGELIQLSSARVPLAGASEVELTVFRERHGNAEHVAITVGQPDFANTVTVRLHSSCFTGDILGSMKCDCGEQLQRAISTMAAGDGGVVLYVSQEGRGIGLASKLLAYQLQDQGLDTIDANQHLGFEADERRYPAAVTMLDRLGIGTIRLMTNNPLKIEALRQHGIQVESRVPSPATVNNHNARYLETKRTRAGHLASCESAG